jgi:hypothetical protein
MVSDPRDAWARAGEPVHAYEGEFAQGGIGKWLMMAVILGL